MRVVVVRLLTLICCLFFLLTQGEWKPKQIPNPDYKGKRVHPEIDNPDYQPDDKLYRYNDIGAIGFDLWQVTNFFVDAYFFFKMFISSSTFMTQDHHHGGDQATRRYHILRSIFGC